MRRVILKLVILVGILVLAIGQIFPPDRTNPPINPNMTFETVAHPGQELASVVRRACYNCHSNETVWPWYSRVAPVSWLVAGDVEEGRSHLNFSEWGLLSRDMSRLKLQNACNQVKAGEMPLWFYVWMHPESRLSEQDVQTICAGAGEAEQSGRMP
jgi:hypothetical protein